VCTTQLMYETIHSDSATGNNITLLSVVAYPVFQFSFFLRKWRLPLPCVQHLAHGISAKSSVAFHQTRFCFSAYCTSFSLNSVICTSTSFYISRHGCWVNITSIWSYKNNISFIVLRFCNALWRASTFILVVPMRQLWMIDWCFTATFVHMIG